MKVSRALGTIAIVALAVLPRFAFAATLFVAPSSGSRDVGKTFTVNLDVSSPDQAINAVDAVIEFPTNLLEAVSVSKSGSILTFWLSDPAISNANGTIRLQGLVPNPGWTGKTGRVVAMTFRAKTSGTANVRFLAGSVLANDGAGTDVLKGLGNGSFTLVAAPVVPVTPKPQPQPPPSPPKPVVPAESATPTPAVPPSPATNTNITNATSSQTVGYVSEPKIDAFKIVLAMLSLLAVMLLIASSVIFKLGWRRSEDVRRSLKIFRKELRAGDTEKAIKDLEDSLK